MIIARDFKLSDIKPIDDIYRKQPELGVPSLKYVVINSTIEDTETNKVLAYGAVKLFTEAILIMDKSLRKRERALALMEAMKTAIAYSREAGVEMLYANSNDEGFSKVLENRYKFHRVPGTLLCLDLTTNFEDK